MAESELFTNSSLGNLTQFESDPSAHRKLLQQDTFPWEVWGYSVIVPIVCLVGVVVNALSLFVFLLADLKESLYTYLTVVSVADLVTVILVMLSGIARGFGGSSFSWAFIDAFIHIPIASVSTTVSIITLVTVTLERLSVIEFPVESRQFCTPHIARRNSWLTCLFSLVFNIPYCFIFKIRMGNVVYSSFVSTRFHNWLRLLLLGFLPAIIFIVSNILLILSLRKTRRRRISLLRPPNLQIPETSSSKSSEEAPKEKALIKFYSTPSHSSRYDDKIQHQRVTLVLIAMVVSFLIGEFPTHLASRSSAVSLIYPTRPHLVDSSSFRIFKLVATILMTCHYSGNFFLYCAFNRRFVRELQRLWRCGPRRYARNSSSSNSGTTPTKSKKRWSPARE